MGDRDACHKTGVILHTMSSPASVAKNENYTGTFFSNQKHIPVDAYI